MNNNPTCDIINSLTGFSQPPVTYSIPPRRCRAEKHYVERGFDVWEPRIMRRERNRKTASFLAASRWYPTCRMKKNRNDWECAYRRHQQFLLFSRWYCFNDRFVMYFCYWYSQGAKCHPCNAHTYTHAFLLLARSRRNQNRISLFLSIRGRNMRRERRFDSNLS